MSLEWFAKLKEYDSLSKMRGQHVKSIAEQEDRIAKLLQRKETKLQEIAQLTSEYLTIQQDLGVVEEKIKIASQQRQRLIDHGGDQTKVEVFLLEIDKLETLGFELLDKSELNQIERTDGKQFLSGLELTTQEIIQEVNQQKIVDQAAIAQFDLRLSLLQEELPREYQELLEKTLAKKLAIGSFTRIENGCCLFCRATISKMEEGEIDLQKKLKVCPQCTRIFIPYGT